MNGNELLRNGVILDSETTHIARGSGIHELAVFDMQTRSVSEYLLKPQLVAARDFNSLQETTRLASSARDVHFIVPGIDSYQDLIRAQVNLDTGVDGDWKAIQRTLQWSNPFLAEALKENTYPHLNNMTESPTAIHARQQRFRQMAGVEAKLNQRTTIDKVLHPNSNFMKSLKGKTIWIANASFESKQLGAQIDGMINATEDTARRKELEYMQRMMETHNPNTRDPMYVTGVDVNRARTMAQQSNDWTQVWKAYLANPPQAGESAVRDIQDVTRAFMSYGNKLGLHNTEKGFYGTGIDVSYRLFGSLEADPDKARSMLRFKEVHRAAEDAAISENYVLRSAVKYTSALQQVYEGTPEGVKLLEQANSGKGLLAEAATYFARLEQIAPELQHVNLVNRLARAQEDMMAQGFTAQITGTGEVAHMAQFTPSGQQVTTPRNKYTRQVMYGMSDVVSFLDESGSYDKAPSSADMLYQKMNTFLEGNGNNREALSRFVESETVTQLEGKKVSRIEAALIAQEDLLFKAENQQLGKAVTRFSNQAAKSQLLDGIKGIPLSKLGKGFGAGALALTGMGAIWSLVDGNRQQEPKTSVASFDYYEWQKHQEQFSGMTKHNSRDGMQHNGINAARRSSMTDFGSPYRGPLTSQTIFADQELLKEREKLLRQQYGARHYDPLNGVFGLTGAFKNLNAFGRKGYQYVQGGKAVQFNGQHGLRGNLLALNLSGGGWKVEAPDADTITIQKGGVRGAVASFFGLNRSYSFRLAGIDSTETSHGSTSYHAPQPHAEAAAAALQSMIAGSRNLDLVYDPSQTTYGRMLGAVIADGKNLNFEVVKQGIAAHLPFNNGKQSMIDYNALKTIETQAYQSGRGMWANPWAKAFYDFSESSGNRMTFNTLTKKESIVKSSVVMSQLAIMEQAQSDGHYSSAQKAEVLSLGRNYNVRGDNLTPGVYNIHNAPANNHLDAMLRDQAEFVRTKGTGKAQNKFSHTQGYGKLDSYLALDSMENTNSVWNRRSLNTFDSYGAQKQHKRIRKAAQAQEQRRINQEFGISHVNHYRM